MSPREVPFWRRILVWTIVAILLALAGWTVATTGQDCTNGAHYDARIGCTHQVSHKP